MSENQGLIKIFEYALNQEKTGMSFFQNSLERMGMGSAMTAFKRLIEEEKRHIEFISGILEDLHRSGEIELKIAQGADLDPVDYFDDRARSEFLQQCVEGSMIPDVTVFNTAWLIEKDLSEFYGRMAEKTDGKAKQALQMLAEWEHEHEKFFRQYRDKLSEVYANMPWGG
ncbi:MAG: ferritin family protein [Desulfomonile tiedjei]|uniref:Ferritin family protein n=1 Tax=Desulfomonile tiedjei TaxID=2358 RepID=A0A9D6Z5U1_9BACT|nr:ferritin family protein [Desulfomonile tiedjei]